MDAFLLAYIVLTVLHLLFGLLDIVLIAKNLSSITDVIRLYPALFILIVLLHLSQILTLALHVFLK